MRTRRKPNHTLALALAAFGLAGLLFLFLKREPPPAVPDSGDGAYNGEWGVG